MDLAFLLNGSTDASLGFPPLRCFEQFWRHDPELWDILDDPGVFRIRAYDAPPGAWVLGHRDFVPNKPASVELVLQNSVAALLVAIDGRSVPDASAWRLDPVLIETLRDG